MLLHLSKDARKGAAKFCKLRGIQAFFRTIDKLFNRIDPNLKSLYQAVAPPGDRLCGKSFLMAVVNQGGTGPHYDWMDLLDGCCCVAPFGSGWTGGELAFRHLGIKIDLRPGDVIFFRSAHLLHENLPHSGPRRSIVLTTDHNSFTAKGQPLDKSLPVPQTVVVDPYEDMKPHERWNTFLWRLYDRMISKVERDMVGMYLVKEELVMVKEEVMEF